MKSAARSPIGQLAFSVWAIAAVGTVIIGLSGALILGFGSLFGSRFTAGDPPGVTNTVARCQEYLRLVPDATDCAEATEENHFDEAVNSRGVLGVLGIGAPAVLLLAR